MLSLHPAPRVFTRRERGQASLMMLAVVGVMLTGALVLFAFGNALGARGKHQRGADLAAISAAQVMRDLYPRLFEPPFTEPGVPNPRHLDEDEYVALARAAALRGGRRNGVSVRPSDVTFPGGRFAPTRVRVVVRGDDSVACGCPAPRDPRAGGRHCGVLTGDRRDRDARQRQWRRV